MTQGTSFRTPALTDAELRASPVNVLGPLTNIELRASPVITSIADGPSIDAFGRFRVSNPQTIFSSAQEYTSDMLHMENYVVGTATAIYTQARASTALSTVDATSGNRAMRQSYVYWRYQPGKSQVVKITGTLSKSGTPVGAAVARIGLFSDSNGMYFGRDATGYFVAIRSDVTGIVVETNVYQASWNLDKMDGTGPSGIIVDFTKEQIFYIDFQWLGVGRVRMGLVIAGVLTYVNEFDFANVATSVYTRSPNLPIRYEVFNSGGAGSLITMECVCCAIESEGGVSDEGGFNFEFDNVSAPKSCPNSATLTPVLSLRCKDTFNGLTYRGLVRNIVNNFLVDENTYFEWRWNTTLTGAVWTDVDTTYSGMEYDITATAVTGGVHTSSGLISTTGTGVSQAGSGNVVTPTRLIPARSYANVRDVLTLCARGIGGTSVVYATCGFEEQR